MEPVSIPSHGDRLKFTEYIRVQADRDLNDRSRIGAIIYTTARLVVFLFTSVKDLNPALVYGVGGYLFIVTLWRLALVKNFGVMTIRLCYSRRNRPKFVPWNWSRPRSGRRQQIRSRVSSWQT